MDMWTVRLHQSHRNGARNPKQRWIVDPPGYDYERRAAADWHKAGGKQFQWGNGISKRKAWYEAMDYANKMARTRKIVLPKLPKIDKYGNDVPGAPRLNIGWQYLGMNRDVLMLWLKDGLRELIYIKPTELRPLALTLLALAEEREDKK